MTTRSLRLLLIPSFEQRHKSKMRFFLPWLFQLSSIWPLKRVLMLSSVQFVLLRSTGSALKTSNFRKDRTRLFVPYKQDASTREISVLSISCWIITAIRSAYETTGQNPQELKLARVQAHEVRALSTSWAGSNGISVDEILRAASWRSKGVFTSFFLRDVSSFQEGLFSLGPIFAAQSVIK